jgi:hypothetical protein
MVMELQRHHLPMMAYRTQCRQGWRLNVFFLMIFAEPAKGIRLKPLWKVAMEVSSLWKAIWSTCECESHQGQCGDENPAALFSFLFSKICDGS